MSNPNDLGGDFVRYFPYVRIATVNGQVERLRTNSTYNTSNATVAEQASRVDKFNHQQSRSYTLDTSLDTQSQNLNNQLCTVCGEVAKQNEKKRECSLWVAEMNDLQEKSPKMTPSRDTLDIGVTKCSTLDYDGYFWAKFEPQGSYDTKFSDIMDKTLVDEYTSEINTNVEDMTWDKQTYSNLDSIESINEDQTDSDIFSDQIRRGGKSTCLKNINCISPCFIEDEVFTCDKYGDVESDTGSGNTCDTNIEEDTVKFSSVTNLLKPFSP
ncbi:hypothetical protein AX774_g3525 [Zancudomyces culisetae]|uniref:Uncharacterized protein n=1 Tax=Zancudomyces culisetae TaxID=1213189 RepID=A0A1R1PPR0_ZANCU|nr:hypothetical protein AX774_g3525 [Zancudomyces culisetae]|eukprot:OMH82976.1 hypothetical protein AX774_g3525 [Zancudomyces culisetae]